MVGQSQSSAGGREFTLRAHLFVSTRRKNSDPAALFSRCAYSKEATGMTHREIARNGQLYDSQSTFVPNLFCRPSNYIWLCPKNSFKN
jgi:hypothetical protein